MEKKYDVQNEGCEVEYYSYAEIIWRETLYLGKEMLENALKEISTFKESEDKLIKSTLGWIDSVLNKLHQIAVERQQRTDDIMLWAPEKGCAYRLLLFQLRLTSVKGELSAQKEGEESYELYKHLNELCETLMDFMFNTEAYIAYNMESLKERRKAFDK